MSTGPTSSEQKAEEKKAREWDDEEEEDETEVVAVEVQPHTLTRPLSAAGERTRP